MNKEIPLLPVGTVLRGTYRIERFIHSGGFGCVYEVRHVLLGTRHSVKEFFVKEFCNREEGTGRVTIGTESQAKMVAHLRKKFVEEACAINGMSHPNIVRVTDVFEENGTAYYVMDYIDGESLGDMVERKGRLSEAQAVGYITQVADALGYVHSLNRLHLDIKPGNIMIGKDGRAILIDFGVSKQYDEVSGENTSTLAGKTPGFAPIEQMGNSVKKFTPATDIYALGATLYKLLTGERPPSSADRANDDELRPLPDSCSFPTRQAVAKAMELRQKDRPQSIADFLSLLGKAESPVTKKPAEEVVILTDNTDETVIDEPQPKPQPKPSPRPAPQPKRTWLWVVLAALVIVGVVIGVTPRSEKEDGYEPSVEIVEDSPAEEHVDSSFSSTPLSFTANGVTFTMLPVEGGTFTMGATAEQGSADSDEKPTHSVTLSSYYMGETEVTQALWQAVMGGNPSRFKGSNLPVELVSWNDCHEFITKLNQLCASQLNGRQFRLPTEAEWEYAARGGKQSKGYKYSGSNTLDNVAWCASNSGRATHAVGKKQANELGLYDMSGNVWEWCSDLYGDYGSSAQTDPTGPADPATGSSRVCRGGGWDNSVRGCRVSYRYYGTPDSTYSSIGLRLAL